MTDIMDFIKNNIQFTLLISILNIILVWRCIGRISTYFNSSIRESMAGRDDNKSLYSKCKILASQTIEKYKSNKKMCSFYLKACNKMKKSGYRNEYAAVYYLILKYIGGGMFFIVSFIINYPSIIKSIAAVALNTIVIEMIITARRKKLNMVFQKYVYKIYKYLHNQISSGVKATDAVKTVYMVINDTELRDILIQLAARYELTMNIDYCLEEFKSNFSTQEVETLCVAIKQGIITGDNQELLARQEGMMFKKYFNYIQAETDNCRFRIAVAAAVFIAIIVVMIAVPLYNDVTQAVSKIFIN